jgi:mannose-6-phosphate isomerase-like protein (cupin superfamily)
MPLVDLRSHSHISTEFGRWQPLNAPLSIDAFGVNAMVCDPGEEFEIGHDEGDTGQQEVYVVISGLAEFTVGEQRLQAGPGVVVSAPDAHAWRSYRALEPETRIVCVGAAPAEAAPYGEWIAEAASGGSAAGHDD